MDLEFSTPSSSADELQIKSTSSKKRSGLIVALIFLIIALALSIPLIVGSARFYSGVTEAKSNFDIAHQAIVDLDFDLAEQSLTDVSEDLEQAQSGLRLVSPLKIVPFIGNQIKVIDKLLQASYETMEATKSVVTIASNVKNSLLEAQSAIAEIRVPDGEFSLESISDQSRQDFMRTLQNSAGELINVQTKLKLAQVQIEAIRDIDGVNPKIIEFAETFEQVLPAMISSVELLIPIAQTLDELAGIDEAKQWLVLFLNNTEMRPGGGFIGVYGLMQVEDGEIQDIYTTDSYSIDQLVEDDGYFVTAPDPLVRYVGVDKWYFRDANWSPDFAESSETAVQLLRQEFSYAGLPVPDVSGVIGITPTIAEDILEITGPVTVREILFNSENVTETLEYYVEYGFEDVGSSWEDRKDIVGELAVVVLNELLTLQFDEWGQVFQTITTAINEKQILVYSTDEETQSVFVDQDWAGVIDIDNSDDILMVVDANLGALKTDHALERSINYQIDEVDGELYATVDVTYQHNGEFDWRTTRYQTYTRIFAPLGSELLSASLSDQTIDLGDFDNVEDLGMTSFGTYFKIEPGNTAILSLVYKLPESVRQAVEGKLYQLIVFKQAGADNYPLTLDLDFGKKLRAADPQEVSEDFGDSVYQVNTTLNQDSVFTVQF